MPETGRRLQTLLTNWRDGVKLPKKLLL